jgi:uncharacterized protein YndB with AHSA1/START domain
MSRLHVEAEGTARVAPDAVWALLSDARSYCRWGPWDEAGYEGGGEGPTDGVGAVRRLRFGRTTLLERIEEVDPQRRMVYRVVKGMPVRNYVAQVSLTPTSEGTNVHWSADWDRTVAGRLVQLKLRTLFPEVVRDLISAAEAGGTERS